MINSWPSSYLTHEQYWQSLSLSPFEMLDSRNPYSPGFSSSVLNKTKKQNKKNTQQTKSHCLFSMFFVGSSSFSQLNGLPRSQNMFFCFLYYLYSTLLTFLSSFMAYIIYTCWWLLRHPHPAQISLLYSRFIYPFAYIHVCLFLDV